MIWVPQHTSRLSSQQGPSIETLPFLSPYFLSEQSTCRRLSKLRLLHILLRLSNEHRVYNRSFLKTQEGIAFIHYQQSIIGAVIRKHIDPQFSLFRPSRLIKVDPNEKWTKGKSIVLIEREEFDSLLMTISVEADYWIATYKMLQILHRHYEISISPENGLLRLLIEHALINFRVIAVNYEGGAVKFREYIQAQNKFLEDLSNPFDMQFFAKERPEKSRIYEQQDVKLSWFYIERALDYAHQDPEFKRNFFNPFYRLRMKLTTILKKDQSLIWRDGIERQQGRKRKTR
ncbi:MAG: hypothetical protein WBA57_19660 [Elainellaceae cyanobacterium]